MACTFKCLDKLPLLGRCDTSKDRILLNCLTDLFFCRQRGRIHKVIRTRNTGFLSHLRYCHRIVTRDDLDLYPLLFKVSKGLRRFLSDRVCKHNIGKWRHFPTKRPAVRCLFTVSKHQYPIAFGSFLFNLFLICRIIVPQDKLRSTKHIGALFKGSTAIFIFGGKRRDLLRLSPSTLLKIGLYRLHGDIVPAHGMCKIPDQTL